MSDEPKKSAKNFLYLLNATVPTRNCALSASYLGCAFVSVDSVYDGSHVPHTS